MGHLLTSSRSRTVYPRESQPPASAPNLLNKVIGPPNRSEALSVAGEMMNSPHSLPPLTILYARSNCLLDDFTTGDCGVFSGACTGSFVAPNGKKPGNHNCPPSLGGGVVVASQGHLKPGAALGIGAAGASQGQRKAGSAGAGVVSAESQGH